MKNKKKLLLLFLSVLVFLPALTVAGPFDYTPMEKIPGFETADTSNFYNYIGIVYQFGLWAVGISAMLMISIGGYMYMTSAGNTTSMGKARGIITDALAGLILAMLSYLILYEINPDLVKLTGGATGGSATGTVSTAPISTGTLAIGCNKYTAAFASASGGDKNLQCLLIGIANAESSCNPTITSPANACGLMQLLPATAGISCAELNANPIKSIQLAADYIKKNQTTIPSSSGFNVGKKYSLSENTVSYGSFLYDTGNDDLIASYSAGSGKLATTPGMKGPFEISSDCPNPITPAWQCHIKPDGFSETQKYVMRVQSFQKACLLKP